MAFDRPPGSGWPRVACWVLVALTAALWYGNTFRSPFYLDDYPSIVNNHSLHHCGDLRSVWQQTPRRFIGYASFALNYWVGGTAVVGYHIVNLLIHIGAALAVGWLAMLICASPVMRSRLAPDRGRLIALFAALLFAAHPVQTQAVTYIVQRLASLCAAWYVVAVCCYLKARFIQVSDGKRRAAVWWFAGALASGLLAVFTKETAYTLPLALALSELLLIRREGRIQWRYPLGWAAALGALAAIAVAGLRLPTRETDAIGRWSYLMTQCHVLLRYLRLLVLPVGQNLDYDFPVSRGLLEGPVLLGLAAAAGLAAIALWCARRRPAIAFGIGWFFVTMAVESSVIPIRDVIFEHRLYLPMAGCAIAAADATGWLLQGMRRRLLVTVMAVTVLGLGLSTYARNEIWRDPLRLWNDAVAKSPLKFRPYIYRGTAYNQVGTYRRAIADFDRALELQPGLTKALYDKGNSYLSLGLPDSAIRCYGQALAVDSGYADAWVNSGIAWSRRGDTSRAAACFSRAVQIDTADIQARYYRALAEIALRQDSLAVADLRTVLAADPTYVTAYKALGRALLQRGDPAAAEIAFLRYIEHQPDDPEGYQLQTHARRARRTNTPGRMGPGNAPHNKVP